MKTLKQLEICNMRYERLCTLLDNSGIGVSNVTETNTLNEIPELSFKYPVEDDHGKYMYLSNENLVLCNGQYYRIKTTEVHHDNDGTKYINVTCRLLSESLQYSVITVAEQTPKTAIQLMKIALGYDDNDVPETGWYIGHVTVDGLMKRGLEAVEDSRFSVLLTIAEKFQGMLKFDTVNKTVDLLKIDKTADAKLNLKISKDLKNVQITYDTSEMITRLYCFGATDENSNELNIMDVNPTHNAYIENYDYYKQLGYKQDEIEKHPEIFTKTTIWRDTNYYDAHDLYEDGKKKLADMAVPSIEVSIEALDLSQFGNTRMVDLQLGDVVEVNDSDLGARFTCNVTSIQRDYDNPHILTLTVTSLIQYKDMLAKLFSQISTAGTLVSANGTIDGSKVVHLKTYQIDDLSAKYIDSDTINAKFATIDNLNATKIQTEKLFADYAKISDLEVTNAYIKDLQAYKLKAHEAFLDKASIYDLSVTNEDVQNLKAENAKINNLVAEKADITYLDAEVANINKMFANYATVTDLDATNGKITNLESTKATVDDLNATNGNITTLSSSVGDINSLLSGNLTSSNIQSGGISSDSLTIKDGFITNAMIAFLNADKITSGSIDTSKVVVKSKDGNVVFSDNTIQVKDNDGKVRVQIGKDANDDYNIYVVAADGKTMFDATGLHKDGIREQIISDDAVLDNANISGSKLNIDSVVNEINKDGTSNIKSTKILLNEDNQTLDVGFNNIKTSVDDNKNNINKNTTDISAANGRIDTLIKNTTITDEDGNTTTLKDEYSRIDQSVNSLQTEMAKQKSTIDTNTNDIKSITTESSSIKESLDSIEQRVDRVEKSSVDFANSDDFKQLKSDVSSTKTDLDGFKTSVANTYAIKSDTDNSFGILKAKTEELESTTDGLSSSVSQLDETVKTKADNSTVVDLNTSVSNLSNTVNGFKTDVSQVKETLTSKADNKTVEDIESRQSSFENTLNGLNQNLTDYKSTNDGKVNNVAQSVSTLSNTLNGFKTEVSNTYVSRTALDDLSVGGYNMIHESLTLDYTDYDFSSVTS